MAKNTNKTFEIDPLEVVWTKDRNCRVADEYSDDPTGYTTKAIEGRIADLHGLASLAEGIKDIGQIHPIAVSVGEDGIVRGVAGWRRTMACLHNGLKVRCEHVEGMEDDHHAYLASFKENDDRGANSLAVELEVVGRMSKIYKTGAEVAKVLGWSPGKVSKYVNMSSNLSAKLLKLADGEADSGMSIPKSLVEEVARLGTVFKPKRGMSQEEKDAVIRQRDATQEDILKKLTGKGRMAIRDEVEKIIKNAKGEKKVKGAEAGGDEPEYQPKPAFALTERGCTTLLERIDALIESDDDEFVTFDDCCAAFNFEGTDRLQLVRSAVHAVLSAFCGERHQDGFHAFSHLVADLGNGPVNMAIDDVALFPITEDDSGEVPEVPSE